MKGLLALLSLLAVLGCGGGQRQPASSDSQPTVPVIAVKAQMLSNTVQLPGQIKPYEAVDMFAKVTGFITSIGVDRGSHVKQGEIIVRLSAPELLAQRTQAEASVSASQSQVAAAEAKLGSDEATYAHLKNAAQTPGVVAENDLAVAEHAAAADRAQVQAARENTAAARERLKSVAQLESYLEIRAPFNGIVTERNLHPGALVGPPSGTGTLPILRIESSGTARLEVAVPEDYISGIREGQPVSFTLSSLPGKTFQAPIARISHAVDEKTRTMTVELGISPEARLVPGMYATVQWPVRRSSISLFVPGSAVATDLERTFVVRVKDGKVEWVDVKTGMTAGSLLEVFGPLNPNDLVAVRGSDELKPGTHVQVKAQ